MPRWMTRRDERGALVRHVKLTRALTGEGNEIQTAPTAHWFSSVW